MRNSNAIKWEETKDVLQVLDEHLLPIFESVFLGEYIRNGYTVTDSAAGLNDFLKSLTSQELDIFLNLKGSYGRDYISDNTFIEILNHCILRTNALIQMPLLIAMDYVIDRHEASRELLMLDTSSLEKIANIESKLKSLAINILKKLNQGYSPPVTKQYVFKPKEQYAFFKTFREIISVAKNSYITTISGYRCTGGKFSSTMLTDPLYLDIRTH